MKYNGDEVVRKRPRAPELVLNPKNSVEDRIVLRRCRRICPNPRQTMQRTERWDRDMDVVVPDRLPIPSRLISQRGDRDQNQAKKPIAIC